MKRREGGRALVANEEAVLIAAMELLVAGEREFYGYPLSKTLGAASSSMAYTTVYRCLDRLEERGLIAGQWQTDDDSRRPRKVYSITGAGIIAAKGLDAAPEEVLQWRLT